MFVCVCVCVYMYVHTCTGVVGPVDMQCQTFRSPSLYHWLSDTHTQVWHCRCNVPSPLSHLIAIVQYFCHRLPMHLCSMHYDYCLCSVLLSCNLVAVITDRFVTVFARTKRFLAIVQMNRLDLF